MLSSANLITQMLHNYGNIKGLQCQQSFSQTWLLKLLYSPLSRLFNASSGCDLITETECFGKAWHLKLALGHMAEGFSHGD